MAKITSKAKLAQEMASTTGLPTKKIVEVLDLLAAITYREAVNEFVIPGICKIKVVQKKAARRRNPFTGKTLLIGERKALKITPLKRAKDLITPNTGLVIQVLDDLPPTEQIAPVSDLQAPPPAPVSAPLDSPSAPEATPPFSPPSPMIESEEGQIVFPCSACGSILAAPPKTAGEKADCPYCGAPIQVPEKQAVKESPSPKNGRPESRATDFILFSCKACHQEIEAPADMLGMDVECPACGTGLTVPLPNTLPPTALPAAKTSASSPTDSPMKGNRSSMTIRIDLSDLE
jgi:DNA-binding protein HU-beta